MTKLFSNQQKILVIGDAILDIYNIGTVDRVSPEAPVPIVLVTKTLHKLGGAANVANNISKLKSPSVLIGCCGGDYNFEILKSILHQNNIENQLTITNEPTITKVRIVSGVQQIVRVDFEKKISVDEKLENTLLKNIDEQIQECNVVVISDYGKGLITERICKYIIDKANQLEKITIVDPKGSNWEKYRNATVVTPNVKELGEVVGSKLENDDLIIENFGKSIQKNYGIKNLLVTRSEKGMSYFDENFIVEHVKTTATEVFDVSGAGDTVVATLATALSSGYLWLDAVKLANKAAGVVVRKTGTEPITYEELEDSIESLREENKVVESHDIEKLSKIIKGKNKSIVFTNGCFDIIHQGHIKYLQEAKKYGDVLVIGLNSDTSIKRLKGPERPIKKEDERAVIMSSLGMVDYVVVFEEDTPARIIEQIKPDVLVKGGDYKIEDIVGREYAKETIVIPFVEGFSTTSTIEKIKKNQK
ncbi:D-beta-D-heptose 7-phosphate kinase/D-beta-D-heptose 1-phosphate adenosyltransferase [Epilithonimonas hungarica]|uniref:D-glycero-beta-D-manno-heptose-7-phosphate kinase n=1 Tax=Epilithonimonas hungarica TaxID=454006 RepID=UPI0027872B1C|nr:D-glycero-beta-D-manno-heptose-7-phosphate kinase [Epilithonimonas hungarica]MDP9954618.1 D-beta-D-heptose 7-phosphate kinase/D-beta-D-heptose 1-phosphate adenosyltransferase [Epilithonimonas hungarica]